ncbi:hypothetical protein KQX54_007202 [Cotesia glomerata]|uniref:Uncharacterized protein n=1 Tax=Cotesia glomerata TaxID=32391 RepID=A0AAV7I7Q6_COTGL|nr:hypothetical protein KQX54_007202 [Cotesia glomerata]
MLGANENPRLDRQNGSQQRKKEPGDWGARCRPPSSGWLLGEERLTSATDTRARNSRNSNATGKLLDGNPPEEFHEARCHRPVLTCLKEWPTKETKLTTILLF